MADIIRRSTVESVSLTCVPETTEVEMNTVLLVEDDRKIALALSMRLKANGYAVVTARDAVWAMQAALAHRPDAVLLDINLPGGNGFTVAEQLRGSRATASVPVIFITASKQDAMRERAVQLGAAGFLEKPLEPAALTTLLESCIGSSPTA